MWDIKKKKQWYIGFYLDKNSDGTFRIDHLERANNRCNNMWQRPSGKDDIEDTDEIQILPIQVLGEWDFTKEMPYFLLTNEHEIKDNFNKL